MQFKPYFKKHPGHFHPAAAGGISWKPSDLCAAYHFPQASPKMKAIIGIIELGGGENKSDTSAAFSSWGLPAPDVTHISIGGGSNTPGSDADGEVALDIQLAGAAYSWCTGDSATIRVYDGGNTDADFIACVRQAYLDGCTSLSISWGGSESSWSTSSMDAMNAAFAAGLAAGMTSFAASGDNDSGDGTSGVAVDHPASAPNCVGCGGTTKTMSSEVVWNNGPNNGTGGGFSAYFPIQSFQIGAPTGPGRMVPDIAGNADPQTGYPIMLNGQWQVIGGTSAVAPLMAGLFAAIAAIKGQKLGNILPILYQRPAAFFDIVDGNNGAYRAKPGVDPCTGLGAPIGTALLTAFGGNPPSPPPPPAPNQPTAKLTISPTSVPVGVSATLTWQTTNAISADINGVPAAVPSGSRSISSTTPGSLVETLTVQGATGTTPAIDKKILTITGIPPSPPPPPQPQPITKAQWDALLDKMIAATNNAYIKYQLRFAKAIGDQYFASHPANFDMDIDQFLAGMEKTV